MENRYILPKSLFLCYDNKSHKKRLDNGLGYVTPALAYTTLAMDSAHAVA